MTKAEDRIRLIRWKFFQNDDWPEFKKTNEYKRLLNCLLEAGIKMPYANNIIYRIFYAGYFNEPFIK